MTRLGVRTILLLVLAANMVWASWPIMAMARDGVGDRGFGNGGIGGRADRSGDDGDGGRGWGNDDIQSWSNWGSTTAEQARQAASQGWVLSLSAILPSVVSAVPGRILEVDLRQLRTGEWLYEFLVLTTDGRYREVVVDARRNQILQVRRR
jgi:hypothetical protein